MDRGIQVRQTKGVQRRREAKASRSPSSGRLVFEIRWERSAKPLRAQAAWLGPSITRLKSLNSLCLKVPEDLLVGK